MVAVVVGSAAGMGESDVCVSQVFAASSQHKRTVIERGADLLTNDELAAHRPAVEAAILEEFTFWV